MPISIYMIPLAVEGMFECKIYYVISAIDTFVLRMFAGQNI